MDAGVQQFLVGQDALLLQGVLVDANNVGQAAQQGERARSEVEVRLQRLELFELPGLA